VSERLEMEKLYTPAEVARMFRVDPRTVARWARDGKLACVRTPGGQSRFRASEIDEILRGGS
jgi:excisionase family DNA binding protein